MLLSQNERFIRHPVSGPGAWKCLSVWHSPGHKATRDVKGWPNSFIPAWGSAQPAPACAGGTVSFAWGLLYRLFESIWSNAVGEMQGCAVQSNLQLVQLLLEWDKEEWSERASRSYQGWREKTFWFIKLFAFPSWNHSPVTTGFSFGYREK